MAARSPLREFTLIMLLAAALCAFVAIGPASIWGGL